MFVLCSNITIGGMRFGGIHEVEIKRSIYELGATATIKVPVTAVLRQQGNPPAEIETAKAIKAGDAVTIELGYDGQYNTEFKGYVKTLNLRVPLEIICEDAYYLTRKKSITLSGKTTLQNLLQKCGLNVGYAASLTLNSFQADNRPVSWVLGKLKTEYGLVIFFDQEGKIYAGEPFKVLGDEVKYRFRYNIINDNDLKYQHADDVNLKIKAICIYRDGTKVEAELGVPDGTEKKIYFYDVTDKKELEILANAQLKRYSYDGYSGKIETFLFPFAAPAMIAVLQDDVYDERGGNYYIESVTTRFSRSGGRRVIEIGIKV